MSGAVHGGGDARLRDMVTTARSLMQAGRPGDAARIWGQVLALSPDHSQALFHLGQYQLQRNDPNGARTFLERAERADPASAIIPLNTSFTYYALGDSDNEMLCLERALTLDPYFFPALLAKGMLLERTGRPRAAAKVYRDVMTIAPTEDVLSAQFVEPLRHAREIAAANAAALETELRGRIDAIRGRYGASDLRRFEACTDITLGKKKVYTQQPTMLLFPGLPAIQYYNNDDFSWLKGVEAATDMFRGELLNVLKEDSGFVPYVRGEPGAPVNQWAELNHSPRWSAFFLWKDGVRQDDACRRCPKTAALIETMPLAEVPGNAPAVFFSILAPKTRIPPHTGVTNTRLIVHVPLIVPAGCGFRVGNEKREWHLGEAWIFDDMIEHEAWNDSDELRALLIFDIWNPCLNAAERELVCELLNGISDYYASP